MRRFEKVIVVGLVMVLVGMITMLMVGCGGVAPGPDESPLLAEAAQAGGEMTGEWVAGIVGVILSLALEVVPGLAAKWQGLDSTWQRLAWLGGCVVVPLAVLGLGCAGVDVGMGGGECGVAGVVAALRVGFAAYFAGQMTYLAVGRGRRK